MEKNQKPIIKKENVRPLFDSKFIKVFDLQYEEDKHYFDATRRTMDRLPQRNPTGNFAPCCRMR